MQAEKKKSQKLEVLEMIRSLGVTKAKINWSAQDGCCKVLRVLKNSTTFKWRPKGTRI